MNRYNKTAAQLLVPLPDLSRLDFALPYTIEFRPLIAMRGQKRIPIFKALGKTMFNEARPYVFDARACASPRWDQKNGSRIATIIFDEHA
jgi:hypothetical protein